MCDLEAMFHEFKVKEEVRNNLRFYRWEDGDTTKSPVQYRITVNLFRPTSSPGCSNFGLKTTATYNECKFGSDAANFISFKDFHVDNGLKSVATISEATSLIENTKSICAQEGMRLHKLISYSREVIAYIALKIVRKVLKISTFTVTSSQYSVHWAFSGAWSQTPFNFRLSCKINP